MEQPKSVQSKTIFIACLKFHLKKMLPLSSKTWAPVGTECSSSISVIRYCKKISCCLGNSVFSIFNVSGCWGYFNAGERQRQWLMDEEQKNTEDNEEEMVTFPQVWRGEEKRRATVNADDVNVMQQDYGGEKRQLNATVHGYSIKTPEAWILAQLTSLLSSHLFYNPFSSSALRVRTHANTIHLRQILASHGSKLPSSK